MIIIHCMLKSEYEKIKESVSYGKALVEKDGFIHFSTWNSFYYVAPHFMKDEKEKVFLCIDSERVTSELKWEDGDGYGKEYPHLYGLLNMDSVIDVIPFSYNNGIWNHQKCIHILMNTSGIDEDWCYPALSKHITARDRVCVLAFSFWKDTKNAKDWNKQYAKRDGIWYKANTEVWKRYGIEEENIVWIHYFEDTKESALNKIMNSNVLFILGGAPDLMMKRIKEFDLEEVLKRYQGLMIGYSAGAMIQIKEYHISPDQDYACFSYEQGLDIIDHFDIEVHYEESEIQEECIHKVIREKSKDIYALYDDGGLIVKDKEIETFGKVKKYTNKKISFRKG